MTLLVTLLRRKSRCGFRSSCTQSESSLSEPGVPERAQGVFVDVCDRGGEAVAQGEDDFLEHGEGLASGVLVRWAYVGGEQVFDSDSRHQVEGVLGFDQAFEQRDEDRVEGDFCVSPRYLPRPCLLSS